MKCLFVVALVVAVLSFSEYSSAAKTWSGIKKCASRIVTKCHTKCKTTLEDATKDPIKKCEIQLSNKILDIHAKCYTAHGFEVTNKTACWRQTEETVFKQGRSRRGAEANQLSRRIAGLQEYSECFRACQVAAEAEAAQCSKRCPPLADAKLAQALIDCDKNKDVQKDTDDVIENFFIPCATSVLLTA